MSKPAETPFAIISRVLNSQWQAQAVIDALGRHGHLIEAPPKFEAVAHWPGDATYRQDISLKPQDPK
jgi:hypothetical protein